jgi:hypothetical protein
MIAALTESTQPCKDLFESMGISAVLSKPSDDDPFPENKWLRIVRMVLRDER